MLKELKKIWFNTTTNPIDGKYSRKSMTMWLSFFVACVLGIADIWYDINDVIVGLFLGHSLGVTAASVFDKMKSKSID